jgi:hypothetical protein
MSFLSIAICNGLGTSLMCSGFLVWPSPTESSTFFNSPAKVCTPNDSHIVN